jgi:hypothetical protein
MSLIAGDVALRAGDSASLWSPPGSGEVTVLLIPALLIPAQLITVVLITGVEPSPRCSSPRRPALNHGNRALVDLEYIR